MHFLHSSRSVFHILTLFTESYISFPFSCRIFVRLCRVGLNLVAERRVLMRTRPFMSFYQAIFLYLSESFCNEAICLYLSSYLRLFVCLKRCHLSLSIWLSSSVYLSVFVSVLTCPSISLLCVWLSESVCLSCCFVCPAFQFACETRSFISVKVLTRNYQSVCQFLSIPP